MKTLSLAEYQDQTRDCEVLSRDEHGDKVLLRPDGRVIKLFRRKRLLSSALFVPYAARFARASMELKTRGFRAAIVEDTWRIPAIRRQAVVYPMIQGRSLRDQLSQNPARIESLLSAFARFMTTLHQRGVYFRAIHFGNLLTTDGDDDFALIDISESRFHRGPLSVYWRAWNFQPLLKYAEDRDAIQKFGPARFVGEYVQAAAMTPPDRAALSNRLRRLDNLFESIGSEYATVVAASRT